MPNYTTNINLELPLANEFYNIDKINENTQKIDSAFGAVNNAFTTVNQTITANKSASDSALANRINKTDANQAITNASGCILKVSNGTNSAEMRVDAEGGNLTVKKDSTLFEIDAYDNSGRFILVTDHTTVFSLKPNGHFIDGNLRDLSQSCIVDSLRGAIFNSGSKGTLGIGTATLYRYPNGVVMIDFSVLITTQDKSNPETYDVGLNRDIIKNTVNENRADDKINTLVPFNGGVCSYYRDVDTYDSDKSGQGGTLIANSQFWQPARTYNTTGMGGWGNIQFYTGMKIVGTCFGTWT